MKDVEGLDEFNIKMDNIDGSGIRDISNKIAALMLATSKNKCPVDTDNLRSSVNAIIRDNGKKTVITIGTNVEYAPYIEYGTGILGASTGSEYPLSSDVRYTSKTSWLYKDEEGVMHVGKPIPAQPFLRPALYDNDKRIIEIITEAATKEAKGE